jgi:N-methylhydantoinase A
MALDRDAGQRAVASLAQANDQSVEQTALDIVAVANEHMAQALRAVAIKRGVDPRDHVLLSFGGAGGLHVCALADALEIRRAMVPMHGGVLSALGMLASRPGRQLSHSRVGRLDSLDEAELGQGFTSLANAGLAALAEEGLEGPACTVERSVDLRYEGQSYTLNLPWRGAGSTEALFHERHEARYGHRLALPVELVNQRVAVRGPEQAFEWPVLEPRPMGEPFEHRTLVDVESPVPVYWRAQLAAGQRLVGPALICEQVATTWLSPGWQLIVDDAGHLALQRLSVRV